MFASAISLAFGSRSVRFAFEVGVSLRMSIQLFLTSRTPRSASARHSCIVCNRVRGVKSRTGRLYDDPFPFSYFSVRRLKTVTV